MNFTRPLTALFCVIFCFSTLALNAQDKTITGKVTDSQDGSPVAGASVAPKGTRTGTSTSSDGTFRISVPGSVTILVISSVGYTVQEVDISGKTHVEITLVSTPGGLSEVVVTGYGTVRKKDLTGSVATVRAKDFNKGVVTSPDQLIQGKVAGLQIINNSGQPGVGSTIRIRGTGSVRAGNTPLIVVDGVPLEGGAGRPGLGLTAFGSSPGGNPLNFINPNDIASIDILKDASAAAIYGARGANGVIIITTKRAQAGLPLIEVGYSVGTSKIAKRLEVLSGDEYRAALKSYGLTTGDYGASVDAFDEILQTGMTHNLNLAASTGNENSRMRFSASMLDEKAIIMESDLLKYSVGFTGNFRILNSRKLGLDVWLNTSQVNENVVPITNDAGFEGNLIAQALQWNPTHPLFNPNGTHVIQPQFGASSINPLWFLQMYEDKVHTSTIFGSVSPYYKFTRDIEYRYLYSINQSEGDRKAMVGRKLLNIDRYKDRGFAAIGDNRVRTQQHTHTLSYVGQLANNLNLNAVAGFEYSKFEYRNSSITAQDFTDIGIPYYNMLDYSTVSSRTIDHSEGIDSELQSYFLRGAFNYQDKYLLTATIRADGSSKFGEDNKYGYFPSFSAAWNISNEDFMNSMTVIDNAKLRAGWGQTGNQEFPAGASQNRTVVSGPGALQQVNIGNPGLRWETTTMLNVGLDLGFLKNRLNVTLDYFNRETEDVLFEFDFPVPGASNARQWRNTPILINNKGFEFSVNANVLNKRDMNWNFGVNTAFLKNNVTGLGAGSFNTGALHGQGSTGAYAQRIADGHPLNVYYLRNYLGIDPTTGQAKYEQDGDVSFYQEESPNPNFLLGITTDFTYKQWSLVINMNGAYGHYLYNNTAQSVVPITNMGTRNIASSLIGGVKEDLSNPITSSTRFLEKGDYLKMANATLSYNLGSFVKFIRSSSISLTGQNLFVMTDFTGFDPEVNVDKNINGIPSLGIEYVPYPTARRFQLSINFGL